MAISDWPAAERPRERLLAKGAKLLSDAELVAVLLRTGVRGKNAVELARDLLREFGGVTKMLSAGAELGRVKGLGPAKSAQFAAALELACRSLDEKLKQGASLTSPGAVRDYLRLALGGRSHEVFVCIWLDAQHRVISFEEPFRGTLTQTSVYPREIVKAALAANAAFTISRGYTLVCVRVPRNGSSNEMTRCCASSQMQTNTSCERPPSASRR